MGEPGKTGTGGSPWWARLVPRSPGARILLFLLAPLALLAGLGYAFRKIGFLRLEWEVRKHGVESPPRAKRDPADPRGDAGPLLRSLEQLVESGDVDLDPDEEDLDARGDAPILAARAAFGSAHEDAEIPLRLALDRSTHEILVEREPCPEAWSLVESWLPRLERVFASLDRVGPEPRHEPAQDREDPRPWPGPWPDPGWDRLRMLNAVVPWVSVAAVREARRGEHALAIRRLQQGFRLSTASMEEPTSVSFLALVHHLGFALESLRQLLRDLPPGEDLSWFAQQVEAVDGLALVRRTAAHERSVGLDLYRRGQVREQFVRSVASDLLSSMLTVGGRDGVELPTLGPLRSGLYPVVAGHDAARFVQLSSEILDLLDGSLAQASTGIEGLGKRWGAAPWYAPTAHYTASLLTLGVAACVDLESGLRLTRVALADRERGRAAALELLDRTLDPADDRPIRRRSEADGTLTLWCIGSDGIDMEGSPGEGDVVAFLPPREGTEAR